MKRALLVAVMGLAGCLEPKVGGGLSVSGSAPPDMAVGDHGPKAPPAGGGGGTTASDCNGVTDKGHCEVSDKGQIAVVCDVGANKLERFNCTEMQKVCVIDSGRGAICAALPPPTTPSRGDGGAPPADLGHASGDMAEVPSADMAHGTTAADMATAAPMCPSGVDYRGYCASATATGAADTAIWCDASTGQTYVVDCAAFGQTCQVDVCADGAYCCDPPPPSECDLLGLAGQCDGNVARWCADGQVVELDCGGQGQICQVDTCATGAYCCDG